MGGPGLESWSSGSWSTAPEEKTHITEGTAGPRPQPGIWIFSTNTEVTGPDTPAWGQGSRKITQASLPQATLTLAKALVAGSSWSFLEADANPVSSSVRTAPALPQPPNRAAPASEPLGEAQPQPIPQGETWVGISLRMHLTPTKVSSQTMGHTKEKSERGQTSKDRAPFPPPCFWSCQGTSSGNCPCSTFCKVFYSLFSFLFVLFSLHKWKNASGKAAHIWIPWLHTEMSPNSQSVPSPCLRETP